MQYQKCDKNCEILAVNNRHDYQIPLINDEKILNNSYKILIVKNFIIEKNIFQFQVTIKIKTPKILF